MMEPLPEIEITEAMAKAGADAIHRASADNPVSTARAVFVAMIEAKRSEDARFSELSDRIHLAQLRKRSA